MSKLVTRDTLPKTIHGIKVRFWADRGDRVVIGIVGKSNRSFEVGATLPVNGETYICLKTFNNGQQAEIQPRVKSNVS